MPTQAQLEGPTQPHERLGTWQGGALCMTSRQGTVNDGPVRDFIDPVQAGGSTVDPWGLGTSFDPDG